MQITTKVVCFCHLLKCFRSLSNRVHPGQTAPIGAVCSGSTLSLYLTLLNNVSINLQQMTKADKFSDEYFAGILRVNVYRKTMMPYSTIYIGVKDK